MYRKAFRYIDMNNNESLHAFRDVVSNVFRLAMATMKKDYETAPILFDAFLNSTLHMLEAKDAAKASAMELSAQAGETITTALLARDSTRDLFEPPYSPTRKSSPTLVIYPESENQTVVVEKVDALPSESKIVNVTADVPEEIEPTNRIITTVDETEVESDIEPDIEEDIESEPDDDAEEDMTKITIRRKTYFLGAKTNFVYEYVDDENAGKLLGKYENKKIVPL